MKTSCIAAPRWALFLVAPFGFAGAACTGEVETAPVHTTTATGGQGGRTTSSTGGTGGAPTGGGGAGGASTGGGGAASSCDTPPWSRAFTGTAYAFVTSLFVDGDGSSFVSGYYQGALDAGGGPLPSNYIDAFVVKLDPQGNHLWSKQIGGPERQEVYIASDGAGGFVLGGQFNQSIDVGAGPILGDGEWDAIVARFDGDGALLWSKVLAGPGAQAAPRVVVDSLGDILLAGTFTGSIDPGSGPIPSAGLNDVYLIELDSAGALLWARTYGDVKEQFPPIPAFGASGDLFLTGAFLGSIDLGSGPLVSAGLDPDVFLAKLDPTGDPLWVHRFGDTSVQGATSLSVGPEDRVYLAGGFSGTIDFGGGPLSTPMGMSEPFLAAYDTAGQPLWSTHFVNTGSPAGIAGAPSPDGGLYATGAFSGSLDLGAAVVDTGASLERDVWLARFDSQGAPLFAASYGDAAGQEPNAIHVDPWGSPFIAGDFHGTIDFGSGPISYSAGDKTIFVAKLPCPAPL